MPAQISKQTFPAIVLSTVLTLLLVASLVYAAGGTWTDPTDSSLPVDFKIQGEYLGQIEGDGAIGCQVIALGNGAFQAVVYPGGLPGAGWDGKNKSLLDGRLEGDHADFKPAEGKKRYLGNSPEEFSATDQFPPEGQQACSGAIKDGEFSGKTEGGKSFRLNKTARKSRTLGAEPPQGAVILFDGANPDQWQGGRLDETTGLLNTDGKDILTRKKLNNYTMHLEFMLPFRPDARGQGRGNSGFYQVDHYEVQILDSFGLHGKDNECGGIYSLRNPDLNMCLPPLEWQTYDVEFTNAVQDDSGNKVAPARMTVRLNGVVIHDDVEIGGKTGGSRNAPEGTPGPIKLQGHGNPLQFRNIWVVEND